MFNTILKGVGKALPVLITNAPQIIALFKELKRAVKKPAGGPRAEQTMPG